MTNEVQLKRANQVAAQLGMSRSTLYAKIARGEFPQGVLVGPATRVWRSDVIAEWINRHAPVKQGGAA